ncbi:Lsr2 family protein [Amycolatopsis bartoniae]|nr:Lsr2 family protein [Amycolatopsis bartoniae]
MRPAHTRRAPHASPGGILSGVFEYGRFSVAKNTAVQLLDDLNGEPAQEQVRFGLDGVDYDIDLSDENAGNLREILARYVQHGRRTGGRKRPVRRLAPPTRGRRKPAASRTAAAKTAETTARKRTPAKATAPAKPAAEKKTAPAKSTASKAKPAAAKKAEPAAKKAAAPKKTTAAKSTATKSATTRSTAAKSTAKTPKTAAAKSTGTKASAKKPAAAKKTTAAEKAPRRATRKAPPVVFSNAEK